jgi:nicotinamidase-related amidase
MTDRLPREQKHGGPAQEESMGLLQKNDTLLAVVDIQDKLSRAMHARDDLIANACKLIRGARALGLPIVCTEQNPKGLGATVPEVAECLKGVERVSKFSFSCCASNACMQALAQPARRSVLIAGIEAHICVYQTTVELIAAGFHVEVVADACSSRSAQNKHIGLDRCRCAGAGVTSVETVLFELLKVAEGPQFKELLAIVK